MKSLVLILVSLSSFSLLANKSLVTQVQMSKDCPDHKAMVFLVDQQFPDQYMYQVEVPHNGTAEFVIKKNRDYKIEAVTRSGCSSDVLVKKLSAITLELKK